MLLLVLAGLLFFARLRAPLLEPQEARYAEIPRQMLAEGRLLVPVLHGQPYLDKPPLLYWLVMAAYSLCGVHDWAARLVPGLSGVLVVLLTYLWGRRVAGARAGLCGAVLLCLTGQFVYRQRMLTMDGLLCLWVVAALAAAHAALLGPRLRRGWWLLAAAACGLGLLTKGPVALVLVLVPLVLWQRLEPRAARVPLRWWAGFLGLALGLCAPWYVAVSAALPDFAPYFFWKHNVVRFAAPFDHVKPWWFYLPGLLLGLLPWTLLLPGFASYLCRRTARAGARRPAALGLFLLAFLWCLLFFSAAGCKRPTYILPALPLLALALGCYLAALAPRAALWRRGSRLATGSAGLGLLGGLALAVAAGAWGMLRAETAWSLAAGAGLALAVLVLRRRRLSWAGSAGVVFVLLLLAVQLLQPAYNRQFALRGHLRRHARLPDGRRLPVVCYPQRWDSVSFYLPAAEVRSYELGQRQQLLRDLRRGPDRLLLVKVGPVLDGLLRALPPDVEFVPRGRSGPIAVGHLRGRAVLARR